MKDINIISRVLQSGDRILCSGEDDLREVSAELTKLGIEFERESENDFWLLITKGEE